MRNANQDVCTLSCQATFGHNPASLGVQFHEVTALILTQEFEQLWSPHILTTSHSKSTHVYSIGSANGKIRT